jgi:hypothetical protein
LFLSSINSTQLFVQVANVVTTQGGAYWFGSALDAVTQTGVRVTGLPNSVALPVFSADFANPGEALACCIPELVTELTDTPGYRLDRSDAGLLIHTVSGSDYGFTSLSAGGRRDSAGRFIEGGGVFSLDF